MLRLMKTVPTTGRGNICCAQINPSTTTVTRWHFTFRLAGVRMISSTNESGDIDCGAASETERWWTRSRWCVVCIRRVGCCVRPADPQGTYIKDTLVHAVSRKSPRGPASRSGGICNLSGRWGPDEVVIWKFLEDVAWDPVRDLSEEVNHSQIEERDAGPDLKVRLNLIPDVYTVHLIYIYIYSIYDRW